MTTSWQNRIVGHGTEAPDQLLANPRNWRVHPKAQQDALGGLLDTVGWVQDVIVNQRTGHVVDGHLRVSLAISRGEPSMPVVYVDLSETEEALVLASLDPLAAMAVTDEEMLTALLGDVTAEGALADMLEALVKGAPKGGNTDPDDVPEQPEPTTKTGDLWLLGGHRLLCGDCTETGDVGALMQGELADLVWTDPPYGVAAFGLTIRQVCRAGAAWYVAAAPGPLHVIFGQALKDLDIWHQTIIWVKNNATFSPMGVDYHWQHEPIFYGWAPGAAHHYTGGRKQTTVWNIDRPQKSPEHPTMKPVELVERAIENSSGHGQIVYDPFLGSGTTMIASERLGRRCMGMEIDPKYCDVAVKRWEDYTGQKAVLDGR